MWQAANLHPTILIDDSLSARGMNMTKPRS